MTCIVGLEHEGKVYLGGDSMSMNGWYESQVTRLRKVFRVGDFVVGYTSSFRMGQILQYHLNVRQQQDGETDERYMVVAFVESAREALKQHGFATIENNREAGGEFLVGYRGHLYEICADFQVNSYKSGAAAVGSGSSFALGALFALPTMKPEKRIRQALKVASKCSAAVCEPFFIEVLD